MIVKNLENAEHSGAIIKKLRIEKGLNQAQLARALDISGSTVRMIELGKRNGSIALLNKFAEFFDVSLDFIRGQTEYKNSEAVAFELVVRLKDLGLIKDGIDYSTLKSIINEYLMNKK